MAKTPINFEEIYAEYIESENEKNRKERYEGKESFYRASSSGFCSRKIYFESVAQVEVTNPTAKKGQRIMRLGTVMHDDLQRALIYNNNIINNNNNKVITNKESIVNKEKENKNKEKETFHVEGNIEIKELNVRGHYDAVYEGDNVYLFDFKTIANWSYSKKFGKSKDFDPSIHQELQLGTYGYAIQEEFGRLDGMYLVYYNKDNSSMNSKEIPKTFVNRAYNFWYNINEEHKKGLPDFKKGVSPVQDWNCSYCPFLDHCNPPNRKRR